MKINRSALLNSYKFISFLFLLFIVMVFVNLMLNENSCNKILIKNKLNKENKKKCESKSSKILEEFNTLFHCKNIESNLSFNNVLHLTENRFVYYTFALVLGGVLNLRKIVKTGIF